MDKFVYVPKPKLTVFQDTFLKCEIIKEENNNEYRLKVISVHTGSAALLPDLTAEHEDEVITVKKKYVYDSIDAVKLALSERS